MHGRRPEAGRKAITNYQLRITSFKEQFQRNQSLQLHVFFDQRLKRFKGMIYKLIKLIDKFNVCISVWFAIFKKWIRAIPGYFLHVSFQR